MSNLRSAIIGKGQEPPPVSPFEQMWTRPPAGLTAERMTEDCW